MLFTSVLLSLASVTVGRLQRICGSNDLQNVACYKGSELFHWPTDAIAYIMLPGGGYCTGFLVGSGNYLMTNNHCISTQEDAEGSKFEFNYQTKDCGTDRNNPGDNLEYITVYSGADLIYTSKGRDSTLLKLKTDKKLHEIHGSLALSKDRPSRGEEAYIIHHPKGRPKQITWDNCKIDSVYKITGNVRHGSKVSVFLSKWWNVCCENARWEIYTSECNWKTGSSVEKSDLMKSFIWLKRYAFRTAHHFYIQCNGNNLIR